MSKEIPRKLDVNCCEALIQAVGSQSGKQMEPGRRKIHVGEGADEFR